VSFAAITLCVASQRVFIVVIHFVIDSVRKLMDTTSYVCFFFSSLNYFGIGELLHGVQECLGLGTRC
jgi:hypothetical protein